MLVQTLIMKKTSFLLICLIAASTVFAQQKTDNNISSIERNAIDHTPTTITFSERSALQKEQVAAIFSKYCGIDGKASTIVLTNTTTTKQRTTTEKYRQYYKGVPVEHGGYTVLYNIDGYARFVNGNSYAITELPATPGLSETSARTKALDAVNAETYAWQVPGLENHLKLEKNDQAASYYPTGELVWIEDLSVAQHDRKLHLAYKFNVYAIKPLSREHIYVDAATGKILHRNSLIDHINGSGPSLYSGTVNFKTAILGGINKLQDTVRGGGINTYSCGNTPGTTITDITSASTTWAGDAALDAHWGAEKVYDYWFIKQGRNSYGNCWCWKQFVPATYQYPGSDVTH